jgi:hypothetical protein
MIYLYRLTEERMRCRTTSTLGLTLCALLAGPAAAQPVVGWTDAPTFMTLDRQDGRSFAGAQLGWTFFDRDLIDLTTLRLDMYGQFVSPSGLGGYGILPLSFAFIDNFDDETAIGNIEGGVLYVVPRGNVDFVLKAGITLPTADDDLNGFITNVLASFPRLTDLAHAAPETLWLRLGASPIFRSGQLIMRVDAGIDVAVSSDGDEPDPILRLNLGGGVDTGSFAILGELVNVGNLEFGPGDDQEWLHTLAVSARFRAGTLEPGIAIGFPLDDEINDFIDFFISAGLQGTF